MKFTDYYQKTFRSKTEAKKALGISRPMIYTLLRGEPVGRMIAIRVQKATQGAVRAVDLMGL